MQKQSFDLHELFQHLMLEAHAAWRYRWHALVATWCIAVAGALLVFALPSKYESSAQVYADTGSLTNPLLRGIAVQPDVRGRLDIITHTLLSRPNLEAVADKTGLSLRALDPADKNELLARVGNAVRIRDAGARNLYNISYVDSDPDMARKVVQAFLQILMNETLGANSTSTATAQNFLQQQVDDYAARLNAADRKLAEFKKANFAFLPGQGENDYFSRLQDAQTRLQALREQRKVAASTRGTGHVAAPAPDDPRTRQIDAQIADYQKQLDNLLLRYTEAYPDVVSTRRMIGQLQKRRQAIVAEAPEATRSAMAHPGRAAVHRLDAQIAAQEQLVADLRGRADKVTDVQTTLQRLTRDYSTTKKQYDDLVSRLNTAQMSQAATQSGNNLKFRIVDPPFVPLLPVSPKRGLLLVVVFVFALGFGAGLAYFLHKLKPVFTSLKSLRDFGDYPVIGTFSMIVSQVRRRARRREVAGFCTGIGLLVVVLALGFAYNGPVARMVQHVFVMGGA